MEYSIFRFTLNMHNHRSQAAVAAFCGDTAIRLCFTIADGSNIYRIADGCIAVLSGTKADGTKLWNRCEIEGDTIIYEFTEQTASCPGIVSCEITLYGADGKVITAPKFTIVVDGRDVSGNDVNFSESEYDAIDVIMDAAAAEYDREQAEKAREANEEKRQKFYDEKQDKLPENNYTNTPTMWCVSPMDKTFTKDGVQYSGIKITEAKYQEFKALEEARPLDKMFHNAVMQGDDGLYYYTKLYYLKRLVTNHFARGIITASNYKKKAVELGWDEDYALSQVVTNDEPTDFSIAVLGANGTLVVESTASPYVAVNNKRLEERLAEKDTEFDGKLGVVSEELEKTNPLLIRDVYPTDKQRTEFLNATDKSNAVGMKGWYRVAETSYINKYGNETPRGYWSNIFHINVQVVRSTKVSDVVFSAERQDYSSDPSIGILSFDSKRGVSDAITNMRIVYLKGVKGNTDEATKAKAYLEVYINQNSTAQDAWDGTGTPTCYKFTMETLLNHGFNWKLLNPTLVTAEEETEKKNAGWSFYEKSTIKSAWSQVTASVDDINEIGNLKAEINNLKAMLSGLTANTSES